MSYIYWRDNPDIADTLTERQKVSVEEVAGHIDEVSARGIHQDDCACDDPECPILHRAIGVRYATSDETIAWLVARGVLDLELVWREVQR